ncbi:DUF5597 domain-containing protein [Granulicella mallensis]|uniref:Beta-galactosidase n=1 Tax=Granulicella mallensis TaxID=940614 RepID=A0A7W7ZV07_9BACT|nr:DUF5597 domain-containing protein [Granulicella mallensis]MBB5066282.1 hypothetical protein [Granulicella mallensis]
MMNLNRNTVLFLMCLFATAMSGAQSTAHLEKHGTAAQLIVDGQPFLVLGGELANTASSSQEYMKPVWPRLAQMHLNTVLTGMSWAQFEPEEGKFDYALIDGLLTGARQQNLKIIFVWFGSWKNGISSFAPAWVKADQDRFPRAQLGSGRSIEVLSTLSPENVKADSTAYKAFMHHLREVDSDKHTVIMIQIENEVGVLGDSRDRSTAANEAFAGPVPKQLTDYLQSHKSSLRPELKKVWDANGEKTGGTWTEVFGSEMSDEVFMAWNYAHYMNQVTKVGKTEYPVPVFTNTWIVQPEDRGPGDYPSGCPEPHVLDVWRAGGPDIDINAPDIYLPNFAEWVARFHQNGNPLFVPESRGDAAGVANAFYAIGQHDAIGYSPFGIDNVARLLAPSPSPAASNQMPTSLVDVQNLPLTKGYDVLGQLAPLILKHQGTGSIGAVVLNVGQLSQSIAVGNYTITVSTVQTRRSTAVASTTAEAAPAYAMMIATGPDEYVIAASNTEITFSPNTPGPPVAGLAQVQAGHFAEGVWVPGRWLNGDDVLLNYKLAQAAATNQSGSGLRFAADGPTIQSVKLYRYK